MLLLGILVGAILMALVGMGILIHMFKDMWH